MNSDIGNIEAIDDALSTAWEYPDEFVEEIMGFNLWDGQKRILRAISRHDKVSVATGHSIGKSFLVGCLVPLYLFTHIDSLILITSASFRSLKTQTWSEVKRVAYNSKFKFPLDGLYDKAPLWELSEKHKVVGLSSNDPENFGGFHSDTVLGIVDEASLLDDSIYEALLTSATKLIMLGNPLRPEGAFYDTFKKGDWHNIIIPSTDSPNVNKENKIYIKGLADNKFIDSIATEYGVNSPQYKSRIDAQFPESSDEVLIPMHWVEECKLIDQNGLEGGDLIMGVDPGRTGSDPTTIIIRDSNRVLSCKSKHIDNTMATTGWIINIMRSEGIAAENVFIDNIGIGAGICDSLIEQGFSIRQVCFSEASTDNTFLNKRSECYWALREKIEAKELSVEGFDKLAAQLSWARYEFTSKGKLKLEKKEKIKERFGRSPDMADALAITFDKGGDDWVIL